jgi:hypothetical protein
MTVIELITSSAPVNVGQPGGTPSTDELNDGLDTLNS